MIFYASPNTEFGVQTLIFQANEKIEIYENKRRKAGQFSSCDIYKDQPGKKNKVNWTLGTTMIYAKQKPAGPWIVVFSRLQLWYDGFLIKHALLVCRVGILVNKNSCYLVLVWLALLNKCYPCKNIKI